MGYVISPFRTSCVCLRVLSQLDVPWKSGQGDIWDAGCLLEHELTSKWRVYPFFVWSGSTQLNLNTQIRFKPSWPLTPYGQNYWDHWTDIKSSVKVVILSSPRCCTQGQKHHDCLNNNPVHPIIPLPPNISRASSTLPAKQRTHLHRSTGHCRHPLHHSDRWHRPWQHQAEMQLPRHEISTVENSPI